VLKQVWHEYQRELSDVMSVEVVGFGVGVILGTVGKKVAAGRLSLLAVIFLRS
jgi:hypothetical protein